MGDMVTSNCTAQAARVTSGGAALEAKGRACTGIESRDATVAAVVAGSFVAEGFCGILRIHNERVLANTEHRV